MPASQGIAGWVLSARTPLVLEDVRNDPRFSRATAEGTGYVPKGMMAVPLLHGDEPLGVLQVLDRPERSTFSLAEMELLGLFATQAAVALSLLRKARRARSALSGDPDAASVAAVAERLERLEGHERDAGRALLEALARVLR
jgi:GAF domain-containing protein